MFVVSYFSFVQPLTAFVLCCMFRFKLLNAFDFVYRLSVSLLLHVFIVIRVLSHVA